MTHPGHALSVGFMAALALLCRAPCLASDLVLEVDTDRRVTLVGSGGSVRSVLEELCWKAHVVLSYEAPDRPFAAEIRQQPFDTAIGHLLRDGSFVLATRDTEASGGSRRVTSLRVLPSGASAPREPPPTGGRTIRQSPFGAAPASPAASTFTIPTRLLEGAFGDTRPDARDAAVRELVGDITGDPQRLQAFLAVDVEAMRRALAPYPRAREVLGTMVDAPDIPAEARAKVKAIIAALR
jgi:hypothetical protein